MLTLRHIKSYQDEQMPVLCKRPTQGVAGRAVGLCYDDDRWDGVGGKEGRMTWPPRVASPARRGKDFNRGEPPS